MFKSKNPELMILSKKVILQGELAKIRATISRTRDKAKLKPLHQRAIDLQKEIEALNG